MSKAQQQPDSGEALSKAFDAFYANVHNALDSYKHRYDDHQIEYVQLLFPVFLHCYLNQIESGCLNEGISILYSSIMAAKEMLEKYGAEFAERHGMEMMEVRKITLPTHLSESNFAIVLRSTEHPYSVSLTEVASRVLDLLLRRSTVFVPILAIIMRYIKINALPEALDPSNSSYIPTGITATDVTPALHIDWGVEPHGTGLAAAMHDRGVESIPYTYVGRGGDGYPTPVPVVNGTLPQSAYTAATESLQSNAVTISGRQFHDALVEKTLVDDMMTAYVQLPVCPPSVIAYTVHNCNKITCMTMARDASWVAAGSSDGLIRVWTTIKNTELAPAESPAVALSTEMEAARPFTTPIESEEPKPEIQRSAEPLSVTGAAGYQDPHILVGHSGAVYSLSGYIDNKWLLSCGMDGNDSYTCMVKYHVHRGPVWSVDWSTTGKYFVTGGHDRSAKLMRSDKMSPLRIFAGHLADVDVVKFHPNSNYVATASTDRTIRIWDVNTGKTVRMFTGITGTLTCLAFSPNGRLLAAAGIMVWDISNGQSVVHSDPDHNVYHAIAFDSVGHTLCTTSHTGVVTVYDVHNLGGALPLDWIAEAKGAETKKKPSRKRKTDGAADEGAPEEEKDPEQMKVDASSAPAQSPKPDTIADQTPSFSVVKSWSTLNTPVFAANYTTRNVLMVGGPMMTVKS